MPAGSGGDRDGSVLEGALERVTYANPETGYTIARVDGGRGADLITVVGPLLGAQVGESLRMRGRWTSHPKYGKQFEVFSYTTVLPATVQGIQRYLGSGLIKGIGPVMAERMVGHFGADIMHVIDDTPERLIEVDGLGPKRTAMITAAWAEQKAIKEVMVFLQGVGVSTSLAVKIYKKYGDKSVDVVRGEPYRLASDVWGIGFKTADTIAMSVGIARDSPERIKAGLAYTLSEAADDGHCYLPVPNLVTDAAKILEVPTEMIAPCLDELAAVEGVVREDLPPVAGNSPPIPAIYLPPFYQAERSLANALLRLLSAREDRLAGFASVDWDKALGWLGQRTGASLAPGQEQAVRLALTSRVAVLTGGPGCGKSFTVRSVVELAKARRAKVILVAPTGRAAKRLAELTGHEAATIHRLLQLRPGGDASFDADTPLDADLIVVDETSMVDVILANKLLKAIPPGAHLLLVGDADQLPSVGAGEVLRDLLAAGTLPVVRLTQIFRQAQQSGIVVNAHKINAGDQPALSGFGDFFWFGCDDTDQAAELVVDIVARRIPARFGLDPRRDVQVLCPMHRGPAGAGNLNLLLQEALTPFREGQPERRYGGRVFRVGDKVTQLRNNYEKGAAGVFNGTVGVVTAMSPEDHKLTVRTDEDESVDYEFDELDELAHAYAVTIHRSQGSEYPAVVIPLTMASYMMLQRNLIYTGVTRAKKLVVLVGARRALAVAVRTKGSGRRHTALDYRLRAAGTLPNTRERSTALALQRQTGRFAHVDGAGQVVSLPVCQWPVLTGSGSSWMTSTWDVRGAGLLAGVRPGRLGGQRPREGDDRMAGASVAALEAAAARFREHGYVVLGGFLAEHDLRPAQDELGLVFPAAGEYHGSRDPGLRARFAGGASAGADYFPFASVEWSLLGVSQPLAALAEALLGTSAVRVYELHNWAKYTGAADYEQELHRDYGNHTVVVPVGDWAAGAVEMFIYVHDVTEAHGPTHVVSRLRTASLPPSLQHVSRVAHPEVYASEVSAAGPAGTVLAYRTDTFHRGTSMTAPGGARFALKVSYRITGDAWDAWIDRLAANGRIGLGQGWHDFVIRATPRQLELLGFPPRGHRYWTSQTWTAVCQRYPAADLSAFQPAGD